MLTVRVSGFGWLMLSVIVTPPGAVSTKIVCTTVWPFRL